MIDPSGTFGRKPTQRAGGRIACASRSSENDQGVETQSGEVAYAPLRIPRNGLRAGERRVLRAHANAE